jgi:alginate O-acetyltransferase complex protein AlgI
VTFTSWQFGVFAVLVFGVYYLPPLRGFQVHLLVLASLFFYGYGQPELLALLALAVLGTYAFLILSLTNRRVWLPAGIVFNVALLAFFKYKFLFLDPAAPVLSGQPTIDFLLRLPLPIGISFFVFHNVSLLVDQTTSKEQDRRPHLADVFLYIIFFPQLVSGPITRAAMFLPQIRPKFLSDVQFVAAARWIIAGYFFKLFAANNLGQLTTYMTGAQGESLGGFDRCLLLYLYSFQIYSDFFGYTAIAIGLAILFGYRLPINFRLPYLSSSFSEFWTRWHISLSFWLRTYLYIPLGGNRHGRPRTYLNLMVVMALGGLWHGAALGYLVWGVVHGLFLVIERPFLEREQAVYARSTALSLTLRGLRVALTFTCVSFAWAFFKFPDFNHASSYLAGIYRMPFAPHLAPMPAFYLLATAYSLPTIAQHLFSGMTASRRYAYFEPFLYGTMIYLSVVEAGPEAPFIYFQF